MADIDFSIVNQEDVRQELVELLKLTPTFKNADFEATNMSGLLNLMSYNAELFGFYINQIANEPYIDSAKLYKNINRVANNLGYNPIGKSSAQIEIVSDISRNYSLSNEEGYIEIPAYSKFTSSKTTSNGDDLYFTNTKPLLIQVLQFGTRPVKDTDFIYNGAIGEDGSISSSKMRIQATEERSLYIVQNEEIDSVLEKSISIIESTSIENFQINTEYSLVLKLIENEYKLEIAPANTTPVANEIAVFYINEKGEVKFQRTTTSGLLSIGRLGYRNLDRVRFSGTGTIARPDILSRLQMTIPQYSPTVQVMYNGEIISFDSQDAEVVIQSDTIAGNSFRKNADVYVTLELTDRRAKHYGAKLTLKTSDEIVDSDVILIILPINDETFEEVSNGVGDFVLSKNVFSSAETTSSVIKNGSVSFSAGETRKRVVFDTPYNFGLNTSSIPIDSAQDYSIAMTPNANVKVFPTDKTTNGFIIQVNEDANFVGDIIWKTISYESETTEERVVNVNELSQLVNIEQGYTAIIQPNQNVNTWVSQVTEGLKIVSDTSFFGEVDYLIIPNDSSIALNSFEQTGEVYVPNGAEEIEVTFDTRTKNNDYRLFLQADGNVKVWFERKTTEGFILKIQKGTGYKGVVTWQLHEGLLSGTIQFRGGQLVKDFDIQKQIQDITEKQQLGFMVEGEPQISLINQGGFIEDNVNGLSLDYDSDLTINPGLSVICTRSDISYNFMRVFVKIDGTWTEFTEAKNMTEDITPTSKVFYVRVNKDQNISIKFGNGDYRGLDVLQNNVAIVGLKTFGSEGNIGENVLVREINPDLNFNLSNVDPNLIEPNLYAKLRIFTSNGQAVEERVVKDNQDRTLIDTNVTVIQIGQGIFGTEPEGVEDIRKNAKSSYITQDRIVSNTDYRNKIMGEFSEFIVDVQVFNYLEAQESGLITEEEIARYYFNSLFIMAIPSFGTSFSTNQKNLIKRFIDDRMKKQTTIETLILEPTFVPVDVIGTYRVSFDASPLEVQNNIVKGVNDYFDRRNRSLGETIETFSLKNSIDTTGITSLELKMYKDADDKYSTSDYDIDIKFDEYQDRFQDIQDENLKNRLNSELKNLIDKGLVTINQPLFDVADSEGNRNYPFSSDLTFGRFEFPIMGDLSLERRT